MARCYFFVNWNLVYFHQLAVCRIDDERIPSAPETRATESVTAAFQMLRVVKRCGDSSPRSIFSSVSSRSHNFTNGGASSHTGSRSGRSEQATGSGRLRLSRLKRKTIRSESAPSQPRTWQQQSFFCYCDTERPLVVAVDVTTIVLFLLPGSFALSSVCSTSNAFDRCGDETKVRGCDCLRAKARRSPSEGVADIIDRGFQRC